jgi:hypothetical protein
MQYNPIPDYIFSYEEMQDHYPSIVFDWGHPGTWHEEAGKKKVYTTYALGFRELAIMQEGSCVFLGELIYKNMRNANEEINVKKRGGRMETGPLEFIDLRLRDDTGIILARVNRFDYAHMGKELNETIPAGAVLLIRARFSRGFRFGFIQRWKLLELPDKERTRGRARSKAFA